MKAKKSFLSKMFVLIIAAFLMHSCGGDSDGGGNEVVNQNNNNQPVNWNNNYQNPGVNNFSSFRNQVNSGNFRGLNGYSYINFINCPVEINQINNFSDFFDGWFDISFSWNNSWEQQLCGGNDVQDIAYNVSSGSVSGHDLGSSYNQIHTGLKNLVKDSGMQLPPIQYSMTAFQVFKHGKVYLIDLAQPLVANPVMEFPVNNYGVINGNGKQYAGSTIAY